MRHALLALTALTLLLGPATTAGAQVNVNIGFSGVHIGIDVPSYPHLVRVPGYPVYYDSRADANYFFYDGLYWVYWEDGWYSSSWYNGPWESVGPDYVPLYVLRVPVRYYRRPPTYFRGWRGDAPPRWGVHWGHGWESQRRGWDRWNRRSVPAPAPLPVYQERYSGERYPRTLEQERSIRTDHYRYQPREPISQQRLSPAPAQPSVMRESQPAPQVRENRLAPQQARENRPAPEVRENRPEPVTRESRAEQRQPRESQPEPQVREQQHEREQKGPPEGRGREKQGKEEKSKDHGQKDKDQRHERSDR